MPASWVHAQGGTADVIPLGFNVDDKPFYVPHTYHNDKKGKRVSNSSIYYALQVSCPVKRINRQWLSSA